MALEEKQNGYIMSNNNNNNNNNNSNSDQSLRMNLNGIMDNEEFGDVIFVIDDDNEFNGISYLFAAQSLIFKSLLFGSYEESIKNRKSKRIIIKDITCESFKFIRCFFYFQNPKLNCDIVIDVLYSSKIYFIQSLIIKCQQYLLNIEKTKNFYRCIKSFAKYPSNTFYPFFKQFIKNCKALNTEKSYYNDKYLLLNDKLFEKYCKFWQIEEMLKCNINDHNMYNACLRFNNYHKTDILPKIIHLFDFKHSQKFNKTQTNLNIICNNKYLNKDEIISILKHKYLSCSNDNNNNNNNLHHHQIQNNEKTKKQNENDIKEVEEEEEDGFKMNEMVLTDSELLSLRVGDKIDHRDYKGRFCKASITQKQFMFIKLHYVGWNSQYDCWIHLNEDYQNIAKYGRITRRQVQRKELQNLKINDRVLIRLPSCHRFHYMSWINAKVSYIEEDTGQIKFSYGITNTNDNKYSWWTHPDNIDECKPFIQQQITTTIIPHHQHQQQQQQPSLLIQEAQDEDDNDDQDQVDNEQEEEEEEDDDDDDDDDTDNDHNVIGNGIHQHDNEEQQEEAEQILTYDNFEDNNNNNHQDIDDDDNSGMIMCD